MIAVDIPPTVDPDDVEDFLDRLDIHGVDPELVRRIEDHGDTWAVTSVVLDERGRVRRLDGEVLTVTAHHPKTVRVP